jgi:hypothetical protein
MARRLTLCCPYQRRKTSAFTWTQRKTLSNAPISEVSTHLHISHSGMNRRLCRLSWCSGDSRNPPSWHSCWCVPIMPSVRHSFHNLTVISMDVWYRRKMNPVKLLDPSTRLPSFVRRRDKERTMMSEREEPNESCKGCRKHLDKGDGQPINSRRQKNIVRKPKCQAATATDRILQSCRHPVQWLNKWRDWKPKRATACSDEHPNPPM